MKKKNLFRIIALVTALVVAGLFMLCDMGLGLTPLTKFFVMFVGLVIGLQAIPAVLMFIGMVKGVSRPAAFVVKQTSR